MVGRQMAPGRQWQQEQFGHRTIVAWLASDQQYISIKPYISSQEREARTEVQVAGWPNCKQ